MISLTNWWHFIILFTSLTIKGSFAANDTSAACHGSPMLPPTSNFLFCQPHLEICVLEVRYYEHVFTASCPDSDISSPQQSACCNVVPDQCYWTGNFSDATKVHDDCNATRNQFGQCILPAQFSRTPEMSSSCTNSSSIRVIVFSCGNGTCPEILPDPTTPEPTTTTNLTESTWPVTVSSAAPLPTSDDPGVTEEPQAEAQDNTAAIIGGSIGGGVALIGIIVIVVITLRKKKSGKYKQNGIPHVVDSGLYREGSVNPSVCIKDEKTQM